jgi:hypothetical protein
MTPSPDTLNTPNAAAGTTPAAALSPGQALAEAFRRGSLLRSESN